jgi:hypothetical protein
VSIDGPNPETRELSTIGHVMKPFRRFDLERALEDALGETATRPGLGGLMSRAFAGGHSPFLPARATP